MHHYPQQGTPTVQEYQPLLQGQSVVYPPTSISPPPPVFSTVTFPQFVVPPFPSSPPLPPPPPPEFEDVPVRCICQHCQQEITTVTTRKNGLFTWLLVGGLCMFGCILGCCLIPLCIDDVKDTVHKCPNCNGLVGIKKRIK